MDKKPSFAEIYPELAKQWHPTRNGDLKPSDITSGSSLSIYWICLKNHEHVWKARPVERAKGRGCPYCANKRKVGREYKSLAEAFPEIAKEWHTTKNGNRTPETIGEGSSLKVWWRCKNNPDHEWETTPYQRTVGGVPCPHCSGRLLTLENSFGGKYPLLAKQWHPTKNGVKTPFDFRSNSTEKIWWICLNYSEHEWQAQIRTRLDTSGECPVCKRIKPVKLPSLPEYDSELAKEWHPTKNDDLMPDQFSAGSGQKVWWQCKNNPQHEWSAVIANRATKGKGCPFCMGTKAGTNSLALLYPKIAAEWHPTKNELTAADVSPGSRRKVWWQCSVNPEHEWISFIFNRVRGDGSCPSCSQTGKSFAEKYPEVAKEWHPTKNEPVTPQDIAHSTQKKYWWMCSVNPEHEWEATPQNRGINESGCPLCYRERQSQELRDYLIVNTEYFENFNDGIKNVHRLLKLEPPLEEQKIILYRLLYANVVTLMEAFLSDAIITNVLSDPALTRRLVETTPKFMKNTLPISSIYSYFEKLEKEVGDYLQNEVVYHSVWIVAKIYENVLDVHFPEDLGDLPKIIMTRHDIVHRNGKTVGGETINFSVEDVKNTIKIVSDFVSHIEKQLPRQSK